MITKAPNPESEANWNAELEQWQDAEKRTELFSQHGSLEDFGPEAAFVMHVIAGEAVIVQAEFEAVRREVFRRGCPREVFYDALRLLSEQEVIHLHDHEGTFIIVLGSASGFVIDDIDEFCELPSVTADIGKRILHRLSKSRDEPVLRLVDSLSCEFTEEEIIDHLQQLLDTGRASIIREDEIGRYNVAAGVSEYAVRINAKQAVEESRRVRELNRSPGDDADRLFKLLFENHVGTTIRFTDLSTILANHGYRNRDAIRLLKRLAEADLIQFERSQFNEIEYVVLTNGASITNIPISDGLKRIHHHLRALETGRPVIDRQLIGVRTPSQFTPVPRQRKPDEEPGYCMTLKMIEAGIRLTAEESTVLELAQLVDKAFKGGKRVSVRLLRRLCAAYHGILPQNADLAMASLEAKGVIFRSVSEAAAKVIRLTVFGKRVAGSEREPQQTETVSRQLDAVAG